MNHAILRVIYSLSLAVVVLTPRVAMAAQDELAPLVSLSDSFEALVERVSPAVVEIFTTGYVAAEGLVSQRKLFTTETRSGSGVVVDANGYIVTNAHVVAGAAKVQVMFATPRGDQSPRRSILKPVGELVGAQIVGTDSETDLAILKVERADLSFITLGDSDEVKQGELVFAFGSPRGLENSVSVGVVSATARQIRDEDPMIFIQTDAHINPGNSGGPLVNTRGEVVGINTFILTESGGSEGLGFAAPSNIVRYVYEQFRKSGRVRRGEIGARAQTITPLLAEGLGLARNWGVILSDVHPGGKAEGAGLRVGDIVLTLDGKVMENGRQFQVNLYRHAVGETVNLEVLRGTETLRFQVPISERTDDPNRFAGMVRPEDNLIPQLGILAVELDRRVRILLPGLRSRDGVVVAARSVDAPMIETSGFLPGDVIFAVNQTPIRNLSDLRGGDTAVFHLERRRELVYVPVEIPR